MVGEIGSTEVLMLLIGFFLLFGADKVPGMARTLGKARSDLGRSVEQVRRPLDVDRTLADLDRGGMTEHVELAERARRVGLQPAGVPIIELRERVLALEALEEAGATDAAEAAEPAEEAEATEPSEADDAAESAQTAGASEASDAAESAESAGSVEESDAAEPSEAADAAESAESAEPVEEADAAESSEASETTEDEEA